MSAWSMDLQVNGTKTCSYCQAIAGLTHLCSMCGTGTDFRMLSRIDVTLPGESAAGQDGRSGCSVPHISVEKVDVHRSMRSDPVVASIAAGYAEVMSSKMTKVNAGYDAGLLCQFRGNVCQLHGGSHKCT